MSEPHIRDFVPALIETWLDGTVKKKVWALGYGEFHRESYPHPEIDAENGHLEFETELKSGSRFRISEWRVNGDLHRDGDLPAKIRLDDSGEFLRETWYRRGKVHREGAPASIKTYRGQVLPKDFIYQGKVSPEDYSATEVVLDEEWRVDGKPYRDGGLPTKVSFGLHGETKGEEWENENGLHREGDLPASITYFEDMISSKSWYRDGKRHREIGPAEIEYDWPGYVEVETYYRNDVIHRDGGPAVLIYNEDGRIVSSEWYQHGEQSSDPNETD